MTTDNLHELTAAYAFDALDDDERAAYEAHLRECDDCRAELASLDGTVGALAYATEGPMPPAELRNRIVAGARAEPPKVIALRPRRTRLYAATALAAAAAVGLAIGLWAALSGGTSNPRLALTLHPGGTAQLAASGFDPAPAGKIYEIWVIEAGGSPRPAGVFQGAPHTVVALTRPVPKGSTVAVTLERAPLARKPTPPILATTTAV
jgi:anti-sigma-K factor RskA